MENTGIAEVARHTKSEIANQYACQKIIKSWIDHPETPSSQVVPTLHRELMRGIEAYQRKGLVPLAPGDYRLTDVTVDDKPQNFYLAGTDVVPVMQQYTHDLDAILQKEPSSPRDRFQETVEDAAWAYYTFTRLHPFLDGSGRIGRMILKRVMTGRGYKDIIFQTEDSDELVSHLDAMNAVDHSGNLAHLELYLLDQLYVRYTGDTSMQQQITELMERKRGDIRTQKEKRDLTNIWGGFTGLYLHGVAASDNASAPYSKAA